MTPEQQLRQVAKWAAAAEQIRANTKTLDQFQQWARGFTEPEQFNEVWTYAWKYVSNADLDEARLALIDIAAGKGIVRRWTGWNGKKAFYYKKD